MADESDTANNCSPAVAITVASPPLRPDLAVPSSSVSDDRPAAGEAFTLSATVRNVGGADAASTTLRFHRSDNAAISASDVEIGREAVAALAPGESVGESLAVAAPSQAGTYYYGACADAVADESDTANNCSTGVPVTVSAAQTFGAVAIAYERCGDGEELPGEYTYGLVVDQESKTVAIDLAVEACAANAEEAIHKQECADKSTWFPRCAALAIGGCSIYATTRDSKAEAEQAALSWCDEAQGEGEGFCELVESACNSSRVSRLGATQRPNGHLAKLSSRRGEQ